MARRRTHEKQDSWCFFLAEFADKCRDAGGVVVADSGALVHEDVFVLNLDADVGLDLPLCPEGIRGVLVFPYPA